MEWACQVRTHFIAHSLTAAFPVICQAGSEGC